MELFLGVVFTRRYMRIWRISSMVFLSTGDRASHLAISSLQRSMVFCMLSVVYVMLPPCTLYTQSLSFGARGESENFQNTPNSQVAQSE